MRILIAILFGLILLIEPIGERVIQLLAQTYPGLLILIGTGTFVWVIAVRWERFHARFKTTEAQCDTIKKVDLPDLDGKSMATNGRLDETISNLDRVITFLIATHGVGPNVFKSHSPLTLTEIGKDILDVSGGKAFVDKWLSALIHEIDADHPRTGYDVESLAYRVLYKRRDGGTLDAVKDFVFQNPVLRFNDIEITAEMGSITQIMAVYLREKYIDQHPPMGMRSE